MCYSITTNLSQKTFTGYKIVVKDKYGHYYSPYTGVRYEKGKVKATNKCGKYTACKFNIFSDYHFNPRLHGRTAVFESYLDAKEQLKEMNMFSYNFINCNELIIIKLTISGNLRYGIYAGSDIVSGTFIESVESIKN